MNRRIFFPLALGLSAALFACKQNAQTTSAASAFANETDYICDMKVQADWTDTCHYNGKVYAFCGESCKEEFVAAPESFLKKAGGQ